MHALAQIDSVNSFPRSYERILAYTDLSIGKVRSFVLGDSMAVVLRSEKSILEAKGDDFLFYRVLCDSTLSAELSYTFNEKGLLISIGIEFFESDCKQQRSLSDCFLMHLNQYYGNCMEKKTDSFTCNSAAGMQIDFQKQKSEMCFIHTQIEFY